MADPTQATGRSPAATALRVETEELISELRVRRPEYVAESAEPQYAEALHVASVARQLLNFHAAMARNSDYAERLGIRDALMADNLAYVASRERGRGKVLAFAHNSHLKRGIARWQIGSDIHTWWPAGSHLEAMFGPRCAVIGSAVGVSDANCIGQPEAGTLEALLAAVPGPARFIPTHKGQELSPSALTALPARSASLKNPTYFALTAESVTDFDWLVVLKIRLPITAAGRRYKRGTLTPRRRARGREPPEPRAPCDHRVIPRHEGSRHTMRTEADRRDSSLHAARNDTGCEPALAASGATRDQK
jgi:erythromycin esterase